MFMMAMDEMRQAPGLKMWKHHTSTPRHPVRPRDGSMPSIRCPQTRGDHSTACMPVTDQQGGRWRYCAVLKYPSGQNRQKRNTQTKKNMDARIRESSHRASAGPVSLNLALGRAWDLDFSEREGEVWTWGGHHGLTAWSQVKHL